MIFVDSKKYLKFKQLKNLVKKKITSYSQFLLYTFIIYLSNSYKSFST